MQVCRDFLHWEGGGGLFDNVFTSRPALVSAQLPVPLVPCRKRPEPRHTTKLTFFLFWMFIDNLVGRVDFCVLAMGRASGTEIILDDSVMRSCRFVVSFDALDHLSHPQEHLSACSSSSLATCIRNWEQFRFHYGEGLCNGILQVSEFRASWWTSWQVSLDIYVSSSGWQTSRRCVQTRGSVVSAV
jgi:hypothetical protein